MASLERRNRLHGRRDDAFCRITGKLYLKINLVFHFTLVFPLLQKFNAFENLLLSKQQIRSRFEIVINKIYS